MTKREVARRSAFYFLLDHPRAGQVCGILAVGMYFGMGWMDNLPRFPHYGAVGMAYIVVMLLCAARAGNDALMWLSEAAKALKEKRHYDSLDSSAFMEWARWKAFDGKRPLSPVDTVKVNRLVSVMEARDRVKDFKAREDKTQ